MGTCFPNTQSEVQETKRLKAAIRGAVQGVGFRPFIFRLASELGLKGWVSNSTAGVALEAEGEAHRLESFLLRIESEKPPRSSIHSFEYAYLDPKGFERFEIWESGESGEKSAIVLPDIAACSDCFCDIFLPGNRRYLYPFTNCTNCGPRYSIIERLPYDRASTTMKKFPMCDACRLEYENPASRRFHAEPNACPACGPHLELWNRRGQVLSARHKSLLQAAHAIRRGRIVAVKGLGGFHLFADARNARAIRALRKRKGREEKPLALMFPSIEAVKLECRVSKLEERILISPECPIVLVRRLPPDFRERDLKISREIAYDNPDLGVLLPYTPLHHILMRELGFPVAATSGNLSDETICFDEREALDRLGGAADLFLVHDRPIVRHVDDSIVRVAAGRELVLRRARGFAPLPFTIEADAPSVLAVGAHLKNTIAQSVGGHIFVSQHIGDLETAETSKAFQAAVTSFEKLYERKPEIAACDLHPNYVSTQFAERSGLPVVRVQHQYAHILSCMAENEVEAPLLGAAWDGTGFGEDGTVWGGEFLLIRPEGFKRMAHFRKFRLPGGEQAVREPRRSALGMLWELFGGSLFEMKKTPVLEAFSKAELRILRPMIQKEIQSPWTSSAGRLFDGAASLLGVRHVNHFEGQAAMELEFALGDYRTDETYPIRLVESEDGFERIFDWKPMVYELLSDLKCGVPAGAISAKFHNALAETLVQAARLAGEKKIAMSGGCFQNKYLLERAVSRLREEGFEPYWHQRIPPNDGGISLGQVVAAMKHTHVGQVFSTRPRRGQPARMMQSLRRLKPALH